MTFDNIELLTYLNKHTGIHSFTCPHCKTFCNLFIHQYELYYFEIDKIHYGGTIKVKCPKCNKYSLYYIKYTGEMIKQGFEGKDQYLKITEIEEFKQIFPKEKTIAKTFPDSNIPPQLITLYEEMCELFPININASILWSRKWLEKFIILYWEDIPKTQNSLYKKIQWLENENKIQDTQLLDDLRFISNKGGHIESPTEEINFSKSDSELCISIVEDLIEEYYIEPFEKHKRKENLHALREATQNEADRIKESK